MTNLSPAAQVVLDAADDVYWDWSDMLPASSLTIAAAALRAAAPSMEFVQDHLKLLGIAAELEGK